MNDIIKKIKLLREIEPDTAFKETNRKILMMQIKNTLDAADIKTNNALFETFKVFFPWQIFKTAFRPALAVLLIFGLILGSGLSVSAAESSLPGDAFYPLKIATEKIQVSLTFKEERKTEMHIEFAGKRINEVTKIKDKTESPIAKSQKINVAVNKFKAEMENVKTNLEKIDKKVEPQKVVEVAKIIDTKANEYQEILQKTVNDLEAPVKETVAAQVNEGLDSAEKIGDKALEVIIKKYIQGEVTSSEEEVVKRLEKKIATVEDKVIKVEEQVAALTNTSSSEPASSKEPTEEPTSSVSPEVQQTAVRIQETANQVKEVLTQAKELLTSDQKDLGAVLDKVIESKELVKQVEQIAAFAAGAAPQVGADATNTNVNANANVNNVNADVNTNANVNADANVNTNTNVNVNANTNVNMETKANFNVNENQNANTNTAANSNINTNTGTNTNTLLPKK